MNTSFDHGWEQIHKNMEWGGYPSEFIIRSVARNFYNVPDRNKIKILDFGCGAGAHTWYLAREGFDVYAFDGSESAVEKTKRRLQVDALTADLRVQDGINIDYSDSMFDCVIDNVCIYANMINEIKKMYSNVYRVLKEGGLVISSCFSTKTTGYGCGEELEKGTYYNIPIGNLGHNDTKAHFFTGIELYDLLKNIGFNWIIMDTDLRTDYGGKSVVENINVLAYKSNG